MKFIRHCYRILAAGLLWICVAGCATSPENVAGDDGEPSENASQQYVPDKFDRE